MEKKTVGSGLTKRSVLTYSIDEWVQKAREGNEFFATALPTYPERLLSWRQWAVRVLESANCPTEDRLVELRSDGTWTYASGVDPPKTGRSLRLITGLDYSHDEEEATREWYASQILRLVNQEIARLRPNKGGVRTHSQRRHRTPQERRLADLATRGSACQLGCLVERVRWKFRYEKAALQGLDRIDAWRPMQEASVRLRRAKGEQTARQIECLLVDVAKKSSSSFLQRPDLEIIDHIRKLRRISRQQISDSTFRRHLKNILPRLRTLGP